ncbi:MAG: YitT family protein [Clostridia bacterium]|nr:YitT family protein [Clostridia bacterium]
MAFFSFIGDLFKKRKLRNMIMLTVAGIINAFGITVFLSPVKLYDSGISGTSMLLSQLTPEFMSLSVFLIILNVPLFLYGLKKQGKLFTFYAIYTVAIYSVTAWLITDVLPIDVSFASPLAGTDLLLCALFGGIISGVGSGLAVRYGGAMDGVEVMAVIFAKKLGLTVGTFVMIYNVVLYIFCGFFVGSWILPLYSIVTYYAGLKTIDFIVEGLDRNKAAMIITVKPDEVCEALTAEFESGMTRIEATGSYSGEAKTVIYFVVNRFQIGKMRNIVREYDSKAYITITEIADVFRANRP